VTPEQIAEQIVDMVVLGEDGADTRLKRKIATAIRLERDALAAIAPCLHEPVMVERAGVVVLADRNRWWGE
jgi:hypothetical protein